MTEEAPTATKRRHASGAATRVLLLETAERLFAQRGIGSVTMRDIQVAAGQANASVVSYHFGSTTGLVQALIAYRRPVLEAERQTAIAALEAAVAERPSGQATAFELVELVVAPMVSSIERGEMYVPFLARLNEDPKSRATYWPTDVGSDLGSEVTEQLVEVLLRNLPVRARRARAHQFFTSVLHVLADHGRNGARLSSARLASYVDGWAGMLTAPASPRTQALLEE